MFAAIKQQKLLLPFVATTNLGFCGATNGIDICLLFFCAAIKIVIGAQR